jgi:hypothetical protein
MDLNKIKAIEKVRDCKKEREKDKEDREEIVRKIEKERDCEKEREKDRERL